MQISDFIVSQLKVKTKKDILFLLLKIAVIAIVAGEIYDGVRYFSCLTQLKKPEPAIVLFCIKQALFICVIYFIFRFLNRIKKRSILKRWVILLLALSVITYCINGSILGIYYFDGPCWGKVVDADTAEPIAGANVMGKWKFDIMVLGGAVPAFADARETVTDKKGRFFLSPGRKVWLWPFSWFFLEGLYVYAPGYDSHPPRMQVVWDDTNKEKWEKKLGMEPNTNKSVLGRYSSTFMVFSKNIKIYKPAIIRLNKAISAKEQRESSYFDFSGIGCDHFKIWKFKNAIRKGREQ